MDSCGLLDLPLELFQTILHAHNVDTKGGLVAAARCGHGDIVKLLLENGANANEEKDGLSALCYAALEEHPIMFRCLLDPGAKLPDTAMQEKCIKRAELMGVESIQQVPAWITSTAGYSVGRRGVATKYITLLWSHRYSTSIPTHKIQITTVRFRRGPPL